LQKSVDAFFAGKNRLVKASGFALESRSHNLLFGTEIGDIEGENVRFLENREWAGQNLTMAQHIKVIAWIDPGPEGLVRYGVRDQDENPETGI
jgi:hypothetical protein